MKYFICLLFSLLTLSSCGSLIYKMNKKSDEFYTKELSKYKESIEKDLKVHFELPDSINRYKTNTKSMIVLTNQGSDLLKMEEPIFFYNTDAHIMYEGEPLHVDYDLVWRMLLGKLKDRIISIEPKKEIEYRFNSLGSLMGSPDSVQPGNYSMYIELRQVDHIVLRSDTVSFYIK